MNTATTLQLTELFYSLQGEARTVGWPTVFIRLTGCPLRCRYCDTRYAYHGGDTVTLADIMGQVGHYKTRHVTVTGGEPLAQPECLALLTSLCDAGYDVSLETSGAVAIDSVDPRVSIVMDLKTPASGEEQRNLLANLPLLQGKDQLKFVICDRNDYQWATDMLTTHDLASRCEVLFSPSHEQLDGRQLADWVLEDQLPVRMQLQLHKILWGNEPGR
jgi:7-carboxy-7-deazaguanine synthase